MAKRFTDSGKWKRPWYRQLSLQGKVLWQYFCDECDHAGILIADFDLISFQVGFKVDETKLAEALGDKLVKVDADKYFIPSFFEFQYADAKEGFKAKQSAIKILTSYGLIDESDSLKDLGDSYLSVQGQSGDCPSKIKIKGKIIGNTGECEGKPFRPNLEALYKRYPRKEGKSQGLKKLEASIKTPLDEQLANQALDAFLAHHKSKGTEASFIPHFKTWAGSWRDWLDPNHGQSESFSTENKPFTSITDLIGGEAS